MHHQSRAPVARVIGLWEAQEACLLFVVLLRRSSLFKHKVQGGKNGGKKSTE